jgi:hypothetical protein
MMGTRVAIVVAAILVATSATAEEPKELRDARREFDSLQHPTETDRVRYVTSLVRLRESFTRADLAELDAIDAEIVRHPMPATADSVELSKRLVGRWQSPRRPYFYHADGTWAANDDTPQDTAGTWRVAGNRFFQNYRGEAPDRGEIIILLTDTDFVYGPGPHPYYLRKGTAFPWR